MIRTALLGHVGVERCFGCNRSGSVLCTECRTGIAAATVMRSVPGIDRLLVAWDYEGIARSLVLSLKVGGRRSSAYELGAALAERIAREGTCADILTWVPGRAADIRKRGFDHAELIARALAGKLGLPCVRLLERAHDGVDQTSLGARDRKANLAGAFVARRSGGRVAVVDDLVTTGATMAEAARALRVAGASYVEGLGACSVS